jgi:hypothetical protein
VKAQEDQMKHRGKIAPSLYFKGRWIAKCRCGWKCVGAVRPLRRVAAKHVKALS